MFTVCPKCALTLVVTAAELRIAQGYVRCGRCLNVFNALARLSEERPAAAPESATQAPAAAAAEQSASAQPAPASTMDDTGEIEIELDSSVLVTSVRPPAAPEPVNEPEAREEDSTPAAVQVITSPADTAAARSPASASASEPPAQAPREPAALPETAEASSSGQAPDRQQANSPQPPPEEAAAFELQARRPAAGLAWKLGAGALAIALALQVVNHYRDALAANPALSGPLGTIYSALGVKLAPHWNVHAYDVRQLGASVAGAAAGEIIVRASVKNSADRAQPLPLLRVTLQDRFGNRIAARDVPPHDYLPSSVPPGSLLAAGSRVDATMVFVDPGPQAVGFEIDACLRQRRGEVACAHGP
jgi:predicted Zn finger-like uncharacterized protein